MNETTRGLSIEVKQTNARCPVGEITGQRNMAEGRIPVLSCEGACIRGEIARLAANMVAKQAPYARGCHGELITVPGSAMAAWVEKADKIVLIDGCFIRCHGRILENLVVKDKLIQFDALKVYRKYTDVFDIDAVPEAERNAAARQVADSVLAALESEA